MTTAQEFGLQALCICGHREWSHWRGKCRANSSSLLVPCECKSFHWQAADAAGSKR